MADYGDDLRNGWANKTIPIYEPLYTYMEAVALRAAMTLRSSTPTQNACRFVAHNWAKALKNLPPYQRKFLVTGGK